MYRKSLIIILLSIFTIATFGQRWKLYRYEVMFGAGTANYFGDIGGSPTTSNWLGIKDIRITTTRPSFFLGVRYKLRKDMAMKYNINYGIFTATDVGTYKETQPGHNYSMTSTLYELSGQFEYYIITEDRRKKSSAMVRRRGQINNYMQISVYTFAGLGGIYFNPILKKNDNTVIPTSHVVSGYSKINICNPVGIGVKMSINRLWSVGFELGYRWTWSDYIDGLHTKNGSDFKDIYYFGTFNASYKIRTSRKGYPIIFRRSP